MPTLTSLDFRTAVDRPLPWDRHLPPPPAGTCSAAAFRRVPPVCAVSLCGVSHLVSLVSPCTRGAALTAWILILVSEVKTCYSEAQIVPELAFSKWLLHATRISGFFSIFRKQSSEECALKFLCAEPAQEPAEMLCLLVLVSHRCGVGAATALLVF